MISSVKNDQVKTVIELKKKAKARNEAGLFVVEGVRMAAELPPERVIQAYVSESFVENGGLLTLPWGKAEGDGKTGYGFRVETVTDPVFAAMSDTQTPQGILALVKQYQYGLSEILDSTRGPAHLMLLENIQDPGNLGTILRAGEGAGITGLIMSRDTVDIYNPKVIRSTMGSVFRVPFLYAEDFGAVLAELKEKGVRLFAAHLSGERAYEEEDYTGNVGFLIGNEGNGLADETSRLADTLIRIPMAGKVESLNAAVAASVLMFETARQRRSGKERR